LSEEVVQKGKLEVRGGKPTPLQRLLASVFAPARRAKEEPIGPARGLLAAAQNPITTDLVDRERVAAKPASKGRGGLFRVLGRNEGGSQVVFFIPIHESRMSMASP